MTDGLDMTSPVDRLIFNYTHARRSWESWCYMVNYKVKVENHEITNYINNDNLLVHFRYLALKDFHIEITKIIKESNNYCDNIFKLLKELTKDDNPKKDEAFKNLDELNKCEETIKAIIGARDKYFAHLDPDYKEYLKNVPLMDFNHCFVAIENGIMTLTSKEILLSRLDKIPSRDEFQIKM
ncbi:MAG: hypothetical protein MUF75_12345 [Bacteroidia bacterium]|jgi:hypothetical protein|nr:hypothetical protein [Bacteroidia bacterium]